MIPSCKGKDINKLALISFFLEMASDSPNPNENEENNLENNVENGQVNGTEDDGQSNDGQSNDEATNEVDEILEDDEGK